MKKRVMCFCCVLVAAAIDVAAVEFGALSDGRVPRVYTLQGADGLRLDVTDYGGRVIRAYAPDRHGNLADVTLGWNTAAEYERIRFRAGTLIGRYANRIRDGRFVLDGKTYQLPINERTSTRHSNLHGGPVGWDKKIWKVQELEVKGGQGLRLSLVSEDGDMGFPGMVSVHVTYRVLPRNIWRIEYEATTDRPTVINLTHHSFWNLAGESSGDVQNQLLKIFADRYMKTDAGLIPVEIAEVKDSGFDFTRLRAIGASADWMRRCEWLECTDYWYDHNFILRGKIGELHPAATLYDPVSGRRLEIWTTEPCLQMYGAQGMDTSIGAKAAGKTLTKFAGVALETQHAPDSPNHPDWPTTVIRPGEVFRSTTEYRFSAK